MLSPGELTELSNFLGRLQGQVVRVEFSSRLNAGFRMSFSLKLDRAGDQYSFSGESGDVSMFFDPNEAEAMNSDHSSVSLLFGDNLITVRYARKR